MGTVVFAAAILSQNHLCRCRQSPDTQKGPKSEMSIPSPHFLSLHRRPTELPHHTRPLRDHLLKIKNTEPVCLEEASMELLHFGVPSCSTTRVQLRHARFLETHLHHSPQWSVAHHHCRLLCTSTVHFHWCPSHEGSDFDAREPQSLNPSRPRSATAAWPSPPGCPSNRTICFIDSITRHHLLNAIVIEVTANDRFHPVPAAPTHKRVPWVHWAHWGPKSPLNLIPFQIRNGWLCYSVLEHRPKVGVLHTSCPLESKNPAQHWWCTDIRRYPIHIGGCRTAKWRNPIGRSRTPQHGTIFPDIAESVPERYRNHHWSCWK